MPSSNLAIASCCLLVGSASFHAGVGPAHSFLAPQPSSVHRPQYQQHHRYGNVQTSLRVKANTTKSKKWATNDQLSSSSTTEGVPKSIFDMGLSLDTSLEETNADQITTIADSEDSSDATKWILIGGTVMILAAAGALAVTMGNELGIDLELGQLIKDPSASFDTILASLDTMNPEKGMIYFSAFYILAEILAIPAVPILTASSGYLFGALPGTATCLFSAAIAASISFVIGRTLLRGYVETQLAKNQKFQSMDRAIGKDGFKLMLLLRLSPLFPFALSNYLYGASSIQFLPYFFGTLLGFAPGTFAYVYFGSIGKALTIDSASSEPWYVYVGGMAVLVGLLKIAGDVASGVIESMDEDGAGGWDGGDMDI